MTDTPPSGPDDSRWIERRPLAGDASSRRYWRLRDADGATAILTRYPSGLRAEMARDLEVQRWFQVRGLRVAAIHGCDLDAGWILQEDLGDEDAEAGLRRTPARDRCHLLCSALEPLSLLANIDIASLPVWNRPLDGNRMRWELAGFELWYLVHQLGKTPSTAVDRWLDNLAATVAAHPVRICHRDYHLNNLFFLTGDTVAVIDVQDVLVGPDTYDAVSLLEERAIGELISDTQRHELQLAWAAATGAAAGWENRWLEVRLQRSLKVIGTFARLAACGRPDYLPWLAAIRSRLVTDADRLRLPAELVDLLLD